MPFGILKLLTKDGNLRLQVRRRRLCLARQRAIVVEVAFAVHQVDGRLEDQERLGLELQRAVRVVEPHPVAQAVLMEGKTLALALLGDVLEPRLKGIDRLGALLSHGLDRAPERLEVDVVGRGDGGRAARPPTPARREVREHLGDVVEVPDLDVELGGGVLGPVGVIEPLEGAEDAV